MRGTCTIIVLRDGGEEKCGKPSVYSEPCCCGCDSGFEEHPVIYYCAEHFDDLVTPPRALLALRWRRPPPDHLPQSCLTDMNEYDQCECPYYDDGDGFVGGGDCPNEGKIKTARYGWLCAEVLQGTCGRVEVCCSPSCEKCALAKVADGSVWWSGCRLPVRSCWSDVTVDPRKRARNL
jgi:hypothetical protein